VTSIQSMGSRSSAGKLQCNYGEEEEMTYDGIMLTVAGIVALTIILLLAWAGWKVVRSNADREGL
jgi:heme/copper-type cytochrome/quinol oxidase subunit 2